MTDFLAGMPTCLARSSLIGSMSQMRRKRTRLACREPPRHACASTGAGTAGITSSAGLADDPGLKASQHSTGGA